MVFIIIELLLLRICFIGGFVSYKNNWNKKSHPIFFTHIQWYNVWPLNVCQSIILVVLLLCHVKNASFTHETLWAKWTMQSNDQFNAHWDWVVTFKLTPTQPNRAHFFQLQDFYFRSCFCAINGFSLSELSVCVCTFFARSFVCFTITSWVWKMNYAICEALMVGGNRFMIYYPLNSDREHDAIHLFPVPTTSADVLAGLKTRINLL